jgi:hypothetical protein
VQKPQWFASLLPQCFTIWTLISFSAVVRDPEGASIHTLRKQNPRARGVFDARRLPHSQRTRLAINRLIFRPQRRSHLAIHRKPTSHIHVASRLTKTPSIACLCRTSLVAHHLANSPLSAPSPRYHGFLPLPTSRTAFARPLHSTFFHYFGEKKLSSFSLLPFRPLTLGSSGGKLGSDSDLAVDSDLAIDSGLAIHQLRPWSPGLPWLTSESSSFRSDRNRTGRHSEAKLSEAPPSHSSGRLARGASESLQRPPRPRGLRVTPAAGVGLTGGQTDPIQ